MDASAPSADRRSGASRFWRVYFRVQYRLLRVLDPFIRPAWRAIGIGNVVDLVVEGRRSGRRRAVLVGLLRDGGKWYVGHPNGQAAWTRNLVAAGRATLRLDATRSVAVRARVLGMGPDRDRAIAATWQHPFPGNVIYRLAGRHIRAVGFYFELELEGGQPVATSSADGK